MICFLLHTGANTGHDSLAKKSRGLLMFICGAVADRQGSGYATEV